MKARLLVDRPAYSNNDITGVIVKAGTVVEIEDLGAGGIVFSHVGRVGTACHDDAEPVEDIRTITTTRRAHAVRQTV